MVLQVSSVNNSGTQYAMFDGGDTSNACRKMSVTIPEEITHGLCPDLEKVVNCPQAANSEFYNVHKIG